MQRSDIVNHLQRLLEQASKLESKDCFDESFVGWQHNVNVLLSSSIPCSRHLCQPFNNIIFGYSRDLTDLSQQVNNFASGMEEAVSLLTKFERQVSSWQYYLLWARGKLGSTFMLWSMRIPRNFWWGILATVFGTIVTTLFIYFFIPWVNGSDDNNDLVRDSLRPEIVINSISNKDIRKADLTPDTTINMGLDFYYNLFFTLENVGSTAAQIDSTMTEYTWENKLFTVFPGSSGIRLAQTQKRVENMEIFLKEDSDNYFHIRIYYTWQVTDGSIEKYETNKYYEVMSDNGLWKFYVISRDDFASIVDNISEANRIIVRDTQ